MKHRSSSAGFSLVEVTLAIGIAGFCLIVILGLLPAGVQTNRNATSQTAGTNIIAGVVADLRAVSRSSTTSAQFGIQFGQDKTLYFDGTGGFVPDTPNPNSRYRFRITWSTAPTGLRYAKLKITWPAAADPVNANGSVEMFAAFDRN